MLFHIVTSKCLQQKQRVKIISGIKSDELFCLRPPVQKTYSDRCSTSIVCIVESIYTSFFCYDKMHFPSRDEGQTDRITSQTTRRSVTRTVCDTVRVFAQLVVVLVILQAKKCPDLIPKLATHLLSHRESEMIRTRPVKSTSTSFQLPSQLLTLKIMKQ